MPPAATEDELCHLSTSLTQYPSLLKTLQSYFCPARFALNFLLSLAGAGAPIVIGAPELAMLPGSESPGA